MKSRDGDGKVIPGQGSTAHQAPQPRIYRVHECKMWPNLRICKATSSLKIKVVIDVCSVCLLVFRLAKQLLGALCLGLGRSFVCDSPSQDLTGNIDSRPDRYGQYSRSRKELVQYLNPSGWMMSL